MLILVASQMLPSPGSFILLTSSQMIQPCSSSTTCQLEK
ncbi:Uncharacterised protein [Mycobacteroides abscessus subsp. abscessus]|nr:Uncharacterised protein [Mycobacteroides abscessus subsp. abscessus]